MGQAAVILRLHCNGSARPSEERFETVKAARHAAKRITSKGRAWKVEVFEYVGDAPKGQAIWVAFNNALTAQREVEK